MGDIPSNELKRFELNQSEQLKKGFNSLALEKIKNLNKLYS